MEIEEDSIDEGENNKQPEIISVPEKDCIAIECKMVFPTQRYAEICKDVIAVDKELQPELVSRELQVVGNKLIVKYKGLPGNVKKLRTAVGGLLENLMLSIRTLKEFGN
eukprot:TRINITY_DN3771_c0_g2_i1.p1 TRINITY_DN3771_c0_g2~~TRINITY_DN3771_c0_g2_i1.p1  ORF type:complete len:109 (-),score=32.84 TRINITY_DN3771_c0_g2_i1:265-591(-)